MDGDLKRTIRELAESQRSDFDSRRKRIKNMRHDADKLEKLISLRIDWAEKRIKSILREASRLGVTIRRTHDGGNVVAQWKDLELKGYLSYETRGSTYSTSIWTRPRITLRLWLEDKDGKRVSAEKGEEMYGKFGGEALSLIFGKKRLMVYDRLLVAMMNGMGK